MGFVMFFKFIVINPPKVDFDQFLIPE